ncbi:MAG: DNA polymerase III subunit beta [Ruminococcaceae bacterium]|nr:DNA polymerase III subunit beta [Oscillospiraceae bacterium]
MKFICDKASLIEAINTVQKAVSPKSTLPILEGILLECNNGKVILTGNDLEISIKYEIEASVSEEGSIVLNSRMFGDIIRKLPDAPVLIESDENNITNIKCVNVDFNISGLLASEFPKITEVTRDNFIKVENSKLKKMIKQTIFAVSLRENKPVLTGAFFEIENSRFTMVASDGYRLAIRNETISDCGRTINAIVPGKTLNELLKIIKDDDNIVNIYFTDKHVLFEFDNFIVTSRLRDGEYIKYKSAIPSEYNIEINANVASFCDSIDRAALIINTETSKSPLKLDIKNDNITISCSSHMGKVSDIVNVDSSGGELVIGFNHKYLWDAFKNCEDEDVIMKFITERYPLIITPVEGDAFLYMILPIIIQS